MPGTRTGIHLKRLKIGVFELLSDSVSQTRGRRFYGRRFRRHYASIMPQVISAWCRRLGHDVTYATYYGQSDPRGLLPQDLDVVFVSTYTHASAAAYALGKLFRREGTLAVIGGPHARSYPTDCLRFFDLVVRHCDEALIDDILRGRFEKGSFVSAEKPPTDMPSVEERLPEIIHSSLGTGRRPMAANVPLLSSIGCPYTCNFCLDWNSPYASIPPERLAEDLRFIARRLPGVYVSYHDPNFGVNFDETLAAIESVPGRPNPYFMESSLSILKGPRLRRLRDTNCHFVAPGLESWGDYSNKAGVGRRTGREKLDRVVAHFEELHEHVPNLQANFIFGTDVDAGDEPIELTVEFIRRAPYVWPVVNIPVPFGGTPLYDEQLAAGRILERMPFSFYYMPYLVTTLKNYSPVEYYDRMVRLYEASYAWSTMVGRVNGTPTAKMKFMNILRTFGGQGVLRQLRVVRQRLAEDAEFLAFHEGRTRALPAFYRHLHAQRLGRYASLLSEADITPEMEPPMTAAPRPKLASAPPIQIALPAAGWAAASAEAT